MGSLLCCMRGSEDVSAAPPVSCLCLLWPFHYYHNLNSGSAACHRCDTRVAPDGGMSPPANQVDLLDTLGLPPRPLPYDDPQSSPRMVQHPLVSGHDKAPTHVQKLGQPAETKNTHTGSTCTAHKVSASSPKQHSEGSRMDDGVQFCDSSDSEDDCPVCLEEYDYENPKIALQCKHNFHLSCIYEWMERSQACPVCAKTMLFNEDE
uniref:RING-type E3 ubiquitin transferase n=1 Tax=Zea mays TaxID=4577 RepID=B6T6I9_MAIZE|nr:protein binding protein [Zea mays]|eukprot:NP_001148744.1 protein binding protein [Zea mays]